MPVFAKLLQITLHYETRKLDTSNKMRTPEHINIYIIVRIIFVSCANRPTTLFILINSSLEMGQSCETGPWRFLSPAQTISFLLLRKQWCVRRDHDVRARRGREVPLGSSGSLWGLRTSGRQCIEWLLCDLY